MNAKVNINTKTFSDLLSRPLESSYPLLCWNSIVVDNIIRPPSLNIRCSVCQPFFFFVESRMKHRKRLNNLLRCWLNRSNILFLLISPRVRICFLSFFWLNGFVSEFPHWLINEYDREKGRAMPTKYPVDWEINLRFRKSKQIRQRERPLSAMIQFRANGTWKSRQKGEEGEGGRWLWNGKFRPAENLPFGY